MLAYGLCLATTDPPKAHKKGIKRCLPGLVHVTLLLYVEAFLYAACRPASWRPSVIGHYEQTVLPNGIAVYFYFHL